MVKVKIRLWEKDGGDRYDPPWVYIGGRKVSGVSHAARWLATEQVEYLTLVVHPLAWKEWVRQHREEAPRALWEGVKPLLLQEMSRLVARGVRIRTDDEEEEVVPGWALWVVDLYHPTLATDRERVWQKTVGALQGLRFWDGEEAVEVAAAEVDEIWRVRWAHGEGREPSPEDYEAAEFRAALAAQKKAALSGLPEVPPLRELEWSLLKGDPHPGVLHILELFGAEWPLNWRPDPRGAFSPVWSLIRTGRLQKMWGNLALRLGTTRRRVLRAARTFQRFAEENPRLTDEEVLRLAFGEGWEEWKFLPALLSPASLEELAWKIGDEPEDGENEYDPEEEIRRRALREALEIEKLTVEEALRLMEEGDPRFKAFAEMVRVLANLDWVEED